jgi:hypothetical protein
MRMVRSPEIQGEVIFFQRYSEGVIRSFRRLSITSVIISLPERCTTDAFADYPLHLCSYG